ncbi:MAG: DHA2 family efflux MFS transporter permease subunit [Raoultibacter sp.]
MMRVLIKNDRAKVYALFTIVMLGSALGNLSQTALNAMFSGIAPEFSLSVSLGQWLTTLYMLTLGVVVPLAAFLARRFSTKNIIFLALSFFLAGAVLDFIAWDFYSLLAGRVLQAASTGMLLPLVQTIAMTRFRENRRATAMGVAGIALGFAPSIGPTIGGSLVATLGWRSFFVILIILSACLLIATLFCVDAEKVSSHPLALDSVSFVLSTLGFGGLLLAFSNASNYALSNPFVWVVLAVGVVCLALFVMRQKRVANPLINLDIFKSRQFTIGFVAQCLLFASFMGITLIVPLYVEVLRGGSALEAGLVLLPGTVAALLINPLAGILTDRVGVRVVALIMGSFLVAGAAGMIFIDAQTPLATVMFWQGVRSVGIAGLVGPLTAWSLAKLPRPLVTDGSSFSIAVRQVCASLGTATMVFLITLASATTAAPALGYQLAFACSALFAAVTLACIFWRVR